MGGNVKSYLAITIAAALLGASAVQAKTAKVDQPAPDFRVTTLTRDKLDLASLRGKVVVINRWATWCVPCREEFMLFEKYMPFRAKYGFTVIAIETGGAAGSKQMRNLASIVHFPVALDDQAHADAYPIIDNGVPTNYVIDRAGVVRYAKAGAFEIDELEKVVVPLLNQPAPADPAPAPATPNK
jgi:cytochrome c biogenesis protein CcmG, thiol:disulfide interchange protein DsbE